jgi:hypothetical protein
MDPLARKMLKDHVNIKNEFELKLKTDEGFRGNPDERLDYFYKKSVYFDRRENMYPIFRLMDEIAD